MRGNMDVSALEAFLAVKGKEQVCVGVGVGLRRGGGMRWLRCGTGGKPPAGCQLMQNDRAT